MIRLKTFSLVAIVLLASSCSSAGHLEKPAISSPLILVTGATGTQGGAVARELLDRGFRVRGLTRNPGKPRALAMTKLGAEMVQGDYDDADSLHAAMVGVHGVFAVTDFWEHGYEREVAHGRQLVAAAITAKVEHFVYSSVAGADRAPDVAHFDSKYRVEKFLRASGLPFSIIRPVEFMDNWRFQKDELLAGLFVDPRQQDRHHQWIASRDIGFFVAEAFAHPQQWRGQTVEIAGDERTLGELLRIFSNALGVAIQYQQPAWSEFYEESGDEMGAMLQWFDTEGYDVDVAALRKQYPNLMTIEEYVDDLAGRKYSR